MREEDPLFVAASKLPPEIFAVVDGGRFDDLDLTLRTAGLTAMPLYLEGGDQGARAAAGQLVALPQPRDLRAVIDIAKPRAALVLWSWPLGKMALYRHLRTLNLVEIPNEARQQAEADGEDVSAHPAYESVLFRHWDPNVLGALLPLMEPMQRARFLGAATGIAFDAPDYAGLAAAPRPAGLPPAPHGMLRFTAEQMEGLQDTRQEAIYREIAQDILECWPEGIERRSFGDVVAVVRQQDAVATNLHLEGMRALTYLSMLKIALPDIADNTRELDAFLSDAANGATRDSRMEHLYEIVIRQCEALGNR